MLLCVCSVHQAASVAASAESEADGTKLAVTKKNSDEIPLFDGKSTKGWRVIDTFDFKDHGKVEVKDQVIILGKGQPATGISWKGDIPRSNYEFTWKAKRIEGGDFFCGLTFPVKKEFCTLILGGWGGQIVGLSNIDGFSAIENETTQVIDFKKDQWYQLQLTVLDDRITVIIDDKKIIDVETRDRKFSIWWEQEPVTPLGIVTWRTAGAIKDLRLKRVKAAGESEAGSGD